MDADNIIKGIVLLILAVAGNFIAETLGCKTQKLLTEHMFAKHFVILFILYFAIGFTSSDSPHHPFDILKMVFVIYALFIMFTKMNIQFTIGVFLLLVCTYVNSTFITYYKKTTPSETEHITNLESIEQILYVLSVILILIGFALYYRKQHNDYIQTWNTMSFLFGVNKCQSLM